MFNVLIMGAGKIASEFDSPNDEHILTHARAYKKHNDFNLLGFFDSNKEKAQNAAQKWDCDFFEDLNSLNNVDVVSICTPDDIHIQSVQQALNLNPKIIFLEKPITNNFKETQFLMDLVKQIPIAVNYSRRYIKEFQELAVRISNHEFGKFQTGTGYYGKGFIHNGSHMIDLLRLLIGNIEAISKKSENHDFFPNDPSIDCEILFKQKGRFSMHSIDCNNFTIFELDMFFERARIRILDSGFNITIYKVVDDELFSGYRKLKKTESFFTESGNALFNAIDNINNFLNNREKLLCDIYDGYKAICIN